VNADERGVHAQNNSTGNRIGSSVGSTNNAAPRFEAQSIAACNASRFFSGVFVGSTPNSTVCFAFPARVKNPESAPTAKRQFHT